MHYDVKFPSERVALWPRGSFCKNSDSLGEAPCNGFPGASQGTKLAQEVGVSAQVFAQTTQNPNQHETKMLNTNNPKTETPANQSDGVLTPPFDLAAHQESPIDETTDGIDQTKLDLLNQELRLL